MRDLIIPARVQSLSEFGLKEEWTGQRPKPSTFSSSPLLPFSACSAPFLSISAATCWPINNSVFSPPLSPSIHSNHRRSSSTSSVAQQKSQRTNATVRGTGDKPLRQHSCPFGQRVTDILKDRMSTKPSYRKPVREDVTGTSKYRKPGQERHH